MVKVWTLQGNESKATEPHYEHESKQIRCLNALCMSCCGGNQRTVVIVCAKYWQVGIVLKLLIVQFILPTNFLILILNRFMMQEISLSCVVFRRQDQNAG